MSAPKTPKVWSLWRQERLKTDQAIGYIIQNDLARDQKIAELEQKLNERDKTILNLRRDVDRLIVHTKLPLDK